MYFADHLFKFNEEWNRVNYNHLKLNRFVNHELTSSVRVLVFILS